jgi:predicted porin
LVGKKYFIKSNPKHGSWKIDEGLEEIVMRIRKSVVSASVGAMGLAMVSAANAQSNVTLYGILDAGLIYTSKALDTTTGGNAGKQFALVDSGLSSSEFGMAGSEDLGGGLKASFKLESGISVANGGFNDSNGNLFGRQAWVGLEGPFGKFAAGLQFSPFFLALYETDPRGFSLFGSGIVNYVNSVLATGIFTSNAITYTSPRLAGFQASALYALGGVAGDFQAGRQYSGSINYDNGSFLANAAYYSANAGGTAPAGTTTQFVGRTIGAGYRFGRLTVKASFVNYKVAGGENNNVYSGGVDFFASPVLDLNGGVWYTSDRNQTSNHSVLFGAGANYFLSKRTTLYGQVAVVDNHGTMNTGLAINGALNQVGGTTTGVNIGIRHTF